MIVLYILLGIAVLVLVILLLPISVSLEFNKELTYKVGFAGFKVYPKAVKKPEAKDQPPEQPKDTPKSKNFFDTLREKHGFVGAIKEVLAFLRDCITPLRLFMRFVYFKNVHLNISVVGEDAAKTAFDYGLVCSAVYPVLSFLETNANVSYKKIDITADFEGKESKLELSLKIKSCVIFILIFAVRIFKEYKKFSVRNGLQ